MGSRKAALALRSRREISSLVPANASWSAATPLLAEERIQARVGRANWPLRGKDKFALAVGGVVNHYKVAKHFALTITDDDFAFERANEQIEAEAVLDGIYVLRTDLKPEALDATARACKGS